jgi:6,7-dimethyl-8-ribityllumazine synthase
MARNIPERPAQGFSLGGTYALVQSSYHAEFVGGMARSAAEELRKLDPGCQLLEATAPGSFEIPLFAQALLENHHPDAVLTFGLLFEGETLHADLIARSVTTALQELALQHRRPVLHEILVVQTEDQARARCLGTELNRGWEAARAALRAVSELRRIKQSKT